MQQQANKKQQQRSSSKQTAHSVLCNIYILSTRNFSNSALACSIMEMGADKILFAIDWPYNDSERGTKWIKNAPISAKERKKITCQNAIDLFYAD